MDKLKITLTSILATIVVIVFGFIGFNNPADQTTGSVQDGQAYNGTTTESFGTGGEYKAQVLKTLGGELGSVVVTLTSNANLYLCDATTTSSQMGIGFSTTTQCMATFKSTTVGDYPFNVFFTKGLIAISNTTVGMASSTITWR